MFRSKDFRPAYKRLSELRALVPPSTPVMACTATATVSIREEVLSLLEMSEHVTVTLSPNRPNIMYHVRARTDPDNDFVELRSTLRENCVLPYTDYVC